MVLLTGKADHSPPHFWGAEQISQTRSSLSLGKRVGPIGEAWISSSVHCVWGWGPGVMTLHDREGAELREVSWALWSEEVAPRPDSAAHQQMVTPHH